MPWDPPLCGLSERNSSFTREKPLGEVGAPGKGEMFDGNVGCYEPSKIFALHVAYWRGAPDYAL